MNIYNDLYHLRALDVIINCNIKYHMGREG